MVKICKERTCKECGETKPFLDFASAGHGGYRRHVCKSCWFENHTKVHREKIRTEYYDYKKTLLCSRCGFDDYRALHFHHNDDNKEHTVASMVNGVYRFTTIMEEIKKCEVLCANCHNIEHHPE